jgi:hypothetical protein
MGGKDTKQKWVNVDILVKKFEKDFSSNVVQMNMSKTNL